ncbi:hypothetical protein [Muricoccus nepalensis]|nr:hypothetical protein [Roseomonas nepalensis]
MNRKEAAGGVDARFEWQVFHTARGVMVLDGWGSPLGTFRTVAVAVLAMLATEAGPSPRHLALNDNDVGGPA